MRPLSRLNTPATVVIITRSGQRVGLIKRYARFPRTLRTRRPPPPSALEFVSSVDFAIGTDLYTGFRGTREDAAAAVVVIYHFVKSRENDDRGQVGGGIDGVGVDSGTVLTDNAISRLREFAQKIKSVRKQ